MKHIKFAVPLLMSFSLLGGGNNQDSINFQATCVNGGTFPACTTGGVEFTSDPTTLKKIRFVATDLSTGAVVADDVFVPTADGFFDFTESFDVGTFDVQVKHGGNVNGGTILLETTLTAAAPTS